jgi:hypothetical protein
MTVGSLLEKLSGPAGAAVGEGLNDEIVERVRKSGAPAASARNSRPLRLHGEDTHRMFGLAVNSMPPRASRRRPFSIFDSIDPV